MSTVIDFPYRDNVDRHPLWDRFERADLFEQYLDLQAQGVSQSLSEKSPMPLDSGMEDKS